jgi:hypothetical protein
MVKQTSKEKKWRRLSREKVRKCILQSPTNRHPHFLVRQIHYHFKLAIHLIVDYLICSSGYHISEESSIVSEQRLPKKPQVGSFDGGQFPPSQISPIQERAEILLFP